MDRPGLLYVVATLLPLLSFVILLLVGAVRAAARPYARAGCCVWFYELVGGDKPGKMAAYIATGAMAWAFVLSLVGFIMHSAEHAGGHSAPSGKPAHAAGHSKAEEEPAHGEEHGKKAGHGEDRWAGRMEWARVGWYRDDARPGLVLSLGYKIDNLTTIMFLMVTFIGTLIHLFSIGYMGDELDPIVTDHQVHTPHGHLHRRGRFGRFFMFMSLFSFSMLNLVLADNLFQVFLSWELVGICSYLLIGFYYERTSAANAANKAFIVNRVGDAGFIIGLMIIWTYVGTFNFEEIFARIRAPVTDGHGKQVALAGQIVRANEAREHDGEKIFKISQGDGQSVLLMPSHLHREEVAPYTPNKQQPGMEVATEVHVPSIPDKDDWGAMPYWLLVVAGLGVFLGCVGKSAQFPLQVWLPDAMEGPTPVSALIHAATMVAAGVYLVGRCYPLFTPEALLVIAYTGAITLFVAATVAIVMTDIKKVLAYSTVSQLGYMMLALGVGGWAVGLFHLLTHAFFKALLFLCSGAVIYGCHHEQEMTKMGGLLRKMPITAFTMLAGVLAIAGTPLFSGWYSKDGIIAHALGFSRVHPEHTLLFLLPLVTAGITTFYMFRLWFMTFTGEPRDAHVHEHAHEAPWTMTVPLVVLGICSVCVAWGWPIWDAEGSALEKHIHHAQHPAVIADFGLAEGDQLWEGGALLPEAMNVRLAAQKNHTFGGLLALGIASLGFVFAAVVYWKHALDPADAQKQFPGVHTFLKHKWYFDEFYSALVVRPALTAASWCRWFDTHVIDGTVDGIAWLTVKVSKWDGMFDNGIIDGLVNLTARVIYRIGGSLRTFQTGSLRNYVLFLALAAISIYAILSFFAGAGPPG